MRMCKSGHLRKKDGFTDFCALSDQVHIGTNAACEIRPEDDKKLSEGDSDPLFHSRLFH